MKTSFCSSSVVGFFVGMLLGFAFITSYSSERRGEESLRFRTKRIKSSSNNDPQQDKLAQPLDSLVEGGDLVLQDIDDQPEQSHQNDTKPDGEEEIPVVQPKEQATDTPQDTTPPKKLDALLLSAYIDSDPRPGFFDAVQGFTSCSARALGLHHSFVTQANESGSWPYPHFVKIHLLGDLLSDSSSSYRWIVWADADMRFINLDYPLDMLLQYAEQQDTSLIINSQFTYSTYVNNIFIIRNNDWGKRFIQVWKELALGGKSCGYFDQCPFGVAMLQLLTDGKNTTTLDGSVMIDQEFKKMAWETDEEEDVQNNEVKFALEKLACQGACKENDNSGLRKVGQILMLPSWSTPNHTDIPSSLSVEPTSKVENIEQLTNYSWPLTIHAYYSKLFCSAKHGAPLDSRLEFMHRYKNQLQQKCTKDELSLIQNEENSHCWARPPNWDENGP